MCKALKNDRQDAQRADESPLSSEPLGIITHMDKRTATYLKKHWKTKRKKENKRRREERMKAKAQSNKWKKKSTLSSKLHDFVTSSRADDSTFREL